MINFLLRHLAESTVFCLALSAVACGLRRSATARYAVWFMSAAKFAIPTVVLAKAGENLAALLPAAPWVSVLTYRISVLLSKLQLLFPAGAETFLLLAWILGTCLLLLRWWRSLAQRKTASLLPAAHELAALHRVCRRLQTPVPIRLRLSESALEPALHGIWRPTISVPEGLSAALNREEFESVLLHELAHARRFDNLTSAFVHTLVCLFWFHPLLWMVERRLNLERERACDETVVGSGSHPQTYAAGILKVCQFHLLGVTPGISAMTGADLRNRLDLILDERATQHPLYIPWLLMSALTLFMTLIPVAGGYCAQCTQTANPQPTLETRP